MESKAFPSDYGSPLGRDAILAPPTCCCCCCCCTLVAPEVVMANSWAKKSHENHARLGLRPPFSELLWAYAGGAVAGNLIFWIPALVLGFFFVIGVVFNVEEGWLLLAYPAALAIGLAIRGSSTGSSLARLRGEDPGQGAYLGGLVGFGMGILIVGSVVGIGMIVVTVMGGFRQGLFDLGYWRRPWELWPVAAVGASGVCIWILVRGLTARRGPGRMP